MHIFNPFYGLEKDKLGLFWNYRKIQKRRDEERSEDLHFYLASYLREHSPSFPFDLATLPAGNIHKADRYIGELVSGCTDLPLGAFEKLSLLERLPLLENTYKSIAKLRKHVGGRPTSSEVAQRRKKVAAMLAKGMKPGEIAYQLRVNPETIYSDKLRLKS